MILRNLQLNESDRRELKTKIFASDQKNLRSKLTLNKISTCNQESEDRENYGHNCQPLPRTTTTSGLNCDFLLGPSVTIGEARIEELTIERCRLDLEGARVLGKALGTSSSNRSAISTLKSFKMINVSFCDEYKDACEVLLPLLDGMCEAGKRGGCLEYLEFRRIAIPPCKALRSRFFSALRHCKNLKSLKLVDCDLRLEDICELAETIQSLSDSLESLDLSRNQIDGTSLQIILENALSGHKSLKRLVLSHNPIGDDGAIHLSNFLSRRSMLATTRIESLQLIDCDFWSPGCASLASSLKDFSSLKELIVGGEWDNHLGVVANSLKTNVVLEHLLVVSQACEESDLEAHHQSTMETIEYFLALNRGHRKISIDEKISFKLWPMILAGKTKRSLASRHGWNDNAKRNDFKADLWYHLLQRRPELVNLP